MPEFYVMPELLLLLLEFQHYLKHKIEGNDFLCEERAKDEMNSH